MQITFITDGTEKERQARIDKAYKRLIKQFIKDYLEEVSNDSRPVHQGVVRGTSDKGLLRTGTN